MEYVPGLPLTAYCADRQSSVAERLILLRSVCEAVRYAHSRAVIHRDLKPSNILVQPDGAIKLLDFGIAKHLDDSGAPVGRTQTSLRLMTPAYAAPEQIRGETAGVYTDVYSLGVILYELLTGRLPFDLDSRTPAEAELLVVNGEPPKPSTITKRRDQDDLDALCMAAMHKDPQRRYQSVEALVRDIDHYLAGEPLEARPDSWTYRTRKFLRRNRRAVAAATLLVATVTGLTTFYTARLSAARNAALRETARTQRVLRFTLSLFNGGDKEAGPARDLRVETLIERGVAESRSLDGDPEVQAEFYQTLGEVYQKLGEFDRADALLHSALERRRAIFGPRDANVSETEVKLGLLRIDQAKLDDAERIVREALDRARSNLPPAHPGVANATHALGKVLEERGNYPEAIRVLDDAVRLRSGPGTAQAELADSLLELANAHFYAGHYPEAEALNQRLLGMHRQLYGPRHPLVAEDLINLGAIQQERGGYREAEEFHRQALAIIEPFYGKDHYKTASALTLIARALLKQERNDEGVVLLQRAIAIQERVFGPLHPRVASAVNELGTVALIRGRYDEAEAAFQRMLSIYRQVYNGKHYVIGIALANLGSVYMARKDNAHAEPLFREAIAMYGQTLPPGHVNNGITRIKLGRVLFRQNRLPEAEAESLAGYRIVVAQASPSVTWLQQARSDLAAIYTALHQPEKAREFNADVVAAKPPH
jgi:serine/threonine-protein kinase